jgi:hypothetical protein
MQVSYAFLSMALNVALVCATVSSAWLVWRLARHHSSQNGPVTALFLALGANIVILIGLVIVPHLTARLVLDATLTHVFLIYASVVAAYVLCVIVSSVAPILRARSRHRLHFFGLILSPALVAALHLLVFFAWVDCWSVDSKNPLCDFFSDRPGYQG